MYDLNKRAYFTTLGELRMLLAGYPADAKVCTGGVLGSYLHVAANDNLISFDVDSLDEDYSEWYSVSESRYADFWEGQHSIEGIDHAERCNYLSFCKQ